MKQDETFLTAFANLSRHKMRTGLTMLGMIFGVGAVIAMLSIGAGAEQNSAYPPPLISAQIRSPMLQALTSSATAMTSPAISSPGMSDAPGGGGYRP